MLNVMLFNSFVYHHDIPGVENFDIYQLGSSAYNYSRFTNLILAACIIIFYYNIMILAFWYLERNHLLFNFKIFKFATFGLCEAKNVDTAAMIGFFICGIILDILIVSGFTNWAIPELLRFIFSLGGILW